MNAAASTPPLVVGPVTRPVPSPATASGQVAFLMYDLERGGPEMRLLDLARLLPSDLRLQVVSMSDRVALAPEFEAVGVPIHVERIGRPYTDWRTLRRIRGLITSADAQVVNLFDLKGALVAMLPRRLPGRGRRPALVYHSVNGLGDLSSWQQTALMKLMNACDAIVCNSRFSVDMLKTSGLRADHRVELIYNGVDAAAFARRGDARARVRRAYGFAARDLVLGTVGNFRPQKDYPFLIDAYAELRTSLPSLKLLCVGGGPLLEGAKAQVRALGLGDHVAFSGYTSDVAGHLSAMDLFALCSKWEGLPNVILQAMAAGLPVVSSAVGGCPELVEPDVDGLLYESGDRAAFVDAVRRLAAPSTLAADFGEAGRVKVERQFSMPVMIDRYADVFRGLCRSRG